MTLALLENRAPKKPALLKPSLDLMQDRDLVRKPSCSGCWSHGAGPLYQLEKSLPWRKLEKIYTKE
jgi:hypothetical protein